VLGREARAFPFQILGRKTCGVFLHGHSLDALINMRRTGRAELTLNTLVNLLAVYVDAGWRLDAYARLLALNAENGDGDLAIDAEGFAWAAGKNQHCPFLLAERVPAAFFGFRKILVLVQWFRFS
jgi:hypothetical protein